MAQYYTDFSEYTTGQQPSDWTERWSGGTDWTWSVVSDAGAEGGKVLRGSTGNSNRILLAWDDVDSDAGRNNTEILAKVRSGSTTGRQNAVCARGTEDSFGYGYYAQLDGGGSTLAIREYSADGNISLASSSFSWSADTWYWVRFRVNSTSLKAKVWADGESEPGEWTVETTDATLSAVGYAGVGGYNSGSNCDYDRIVIATNGETATLPGGGQTVSPTGIISGEVFGVATVQGDAPPDNPGHIYLQPITSEEAFGLVSVYDPNASGITSISGVLAHGQNIQINGNDFGTKPSGPPLLWDDFEAGVAGEEVAGDNGWRHYAPAEGWSGGPFPYYSTAKAYCGTQSARKDQTHDGDFRTNWWGDFNGAEEAYVSMYVWWTQVAGGSGGTPISKWMRLNCNAVYSGDPAWKQQFQPLADWLYDEIHDSNGVTVYQDSSDHKAAQGGWHRLEVYWKLGDGDGVAQSWVDLLRNQNRVGVRTRNAGDNSPVYSLMLPMAKAHDNTPSYTYYVDQVYIDNTRARVEIGNAANWGDCTIREPQVPVAWSDTEITVTLNQGGLASFDNAWLFVVSSDGTISEGYPLSGTEENVPSYYSTSFSEYPIGYVPSDWTERWAAANSDWTIVSGSRLEHTATAAARRFLSWGLIDSDAYRDDAEILAKINSTTADSGVALRLRGSGNEGIENGYSVILGANDVSLLKYNNGPSTVLAQQNVSRTNPVWVRFRAEGSSLKVKLWNAGAVEPSSWLIEVTDTDITAAGWVGLGAYDIDGARNIEYLAVATGGGTAALPVDLIQPFGISSAEAFGTATFLENKVRPAGVASAEAFGNTVFLKEGTVRTTGIPSGEALGFAVLAGPIIVPAILSSEHFGLVRVIPLIKLQAGISSAESFGALIIPRTATEVLICNRALSLLGAARISALNEDTTPARACYSAYEPVRNAELRRHPWSFALRRAVLTPSSETPVFRFSYSYDLPTDFVRLHPDYDYADESDWQIEGRKLLSNEEIIYLRYIARISDASLYDTLFIVALSYRLAYELCEEITQSNSKKQGLAEGYVDVIRDAKRVNAIEKRSATPPTDTWISMR